MSELTEHMETQRANVERGARLLDKRYPDWYTWINLEKLNMREGCACIIGQTYGELFQTSAVDDIEIMDSDYAFSSGGLYETGCHDLQLITNDKQRAHGFVADYPRQSPPFSFTEEYRKTWEALEQLWVEQIKERYANG